MIEVLISTLNDGIANVSAILLAPRPDVKYLIIHQFTNADFKTRPKNLIRNDVTIHYLEGKGLSRSRNEAIKKSTGNIAIIADDDVTYNNAYFDKVLEVYRNNPTLEVACFKIKTTDSELEYKNYPETDHNLALNIPHYISSIEITFKPGIIKEKDIVFDTRFGLGSGFLPAGEEDIFINDCLAKKVKVYYFPYYIVNHSFTSSGKKRKNHSNKTAHIRGGLYCRLNERKGFAKMCKEKELNKITLNFKKNQFKIHLIFGYLYIFLSKWK